MASMNPKDMIQVSDGLETTKAGQAYLIKDATFAYTYNTEKAQAAVARGDAYHPYVMMRLTCQLVYINGLTQVEEETTSHQFPMGNILRYTLVDESGNPLEPITRALNRDEGEQQPRSPFSRDAGDGQNIYRKGRPEPEWVAFCRQLASFGIDLDNASTDDIRFLNGIVFTAEVTATQKPGDQFEKRTIKVTGVVARPQETGKKATAAVPATPKPTATKSAPAPVAVDADPTELALGFINDVLPSVLRPKAGATLTRGALNIAVGQALIKVRGQYPNITSNNIADTLMVDGASPFVTFDGANFVIATADAF